MHENFESYLTSCDTKNPGLPFGTPRLPSPPDVMRGRGLKKPQGTRKTLEDFKRAFQVMSPDVHGEAPLSREVAADEHNHAQALMNLLQRGG